MSIRIKDKSGQVIGEMTAGPQGPKGDPGPQGPAGPLLSAALLVSPAGSRAAAIAANVNYAVPAYVVGSGRLQVWLDGVLCMAGPNAGQHQYKEIGAAGAASSVIQWHQAIPTTLDILVRSR